MDGHDCCHAAEAAPEAPETPEVGAAREVDTGCCGDVPVDEGHGYLSHKEAHLRRLRRIEGQVRGLERMVEKEQYCIDILTQIAAVNSALRSVSLELLSEHMGHCVVRAARAGGEESDAKIAEANQAIARLVRS